MCYYPAAEGDIRAPSTPPGYATERARSGPFSVYTPRRELERARTDPFRCVRSVHVFIRSWTYVNCPYLRVSVCTPCERVCTPLEELEHAGTGQSSVCTPSVSVCTSLEDHERARRGPFSVRTPLNELERARTSRFWCVPRVHVRVRPFRSEQVPYLPVFWCVVSVYVCVRPRTSVNVPVTGEFFGGAYFGNIIACAKCVIDRHVLTSWAYFSK